MGACTKTGCLHFEQVCWDSGSPGMRVCSCLDYSDLHQTGAEAADLRTELIHERAVLNCQYL